MSYVRDMALVVEMAMPGTGKTEYSDIIDIRQTGGHDNVRYELKHDKLPNLADAKKITLTIEHCDTLDGSFADAGISLAATGVATGQGAVAQSKVDRLPITLKRFIRIKAVAEASAGDSTAQKCQLSVVL